MRVLLAIDGSAASESARRLVGSLTWPEGTLIEVVRAIEPVIDALGMTATPMAPTMITETAVAEAALAVLDDAVASLVAPGRIVRRALLHGRAATVILHEADATRAELVVVGSRGLGPLKSMVLGSVSAEIVDHAPCPVLVVRRPAIGSILLAIDGSTPSQAAATFLGGSHFLVDHPVEVLSVAPSATFRRDTPLTGSSEVTFESDATTVVAGRRWAEAIAASTVESLRLDGVHARWSISQGDPAHEILEAAESFGCDLIVLGSRGHTGLARIVLGSVARNVLLHTGASVLIVHEPLRVRAPEWVRRLEEPLARPVPAAAG